MPGYSCSIKERMLYSSCKNNLVDWVEDKLELPIEKKVKSNRTFKVSAKITWLVTKRILMVFLSFFFRND